MTAPAFSPGQRVTFADANAVTNDGESVLARGIVNGPPIDGRASDDETVWFVPVFTERDNGREATTIYVDERNIASVPEPHRNRQRPPR